MLSQAWQRVLPQRQWLSASFPIGAAPHCAASCFCFEGPLFFAGGRGPQVGRRVAEGLAAKGEADALQLQLRRLQEEQATVVRQYRVQVWPAGGGGTVDTPTLPTTARWGG